VRASIGRHTRETAAAPAARMVEVALVGLTAYLTRGNPWRILRAVRVGRGREHPAPFAWERPTSGLVQSCATFALAHGSSLVVGHNLDEYVEVPGLVVVNPRGRAKRNVTFRDLVWPFSLKPTPRLNWTSRYGSVTYNVFGREFPDGGMNEAGLYVGEMTLLGTVWPRDPRVPRMYHHQWVQYLLDSFATVDEALASLSKALPEGHWHFFLADRDGDVAVVEFLERGSVVYTGEALPYKILCNDPYDAELRDLRGHSGFGGTKEPEPHYESEDPRFRWAAIMLRDYADDVPAVDYAFAVLNRLDLGNWKWAVVCDIPSARLYVRTSLAPKIRWVDFASLDFGCSALPQALDINRGLEGDVADQFAVLTEAWNKDVIGKAWAEIDAGFMGNRFFKPRMVRALATASTASSCTEE